MMMFEFSNNQHNEPKHIDDAQLLAWILDGSLVITELESEHPQLTFRGRTLAAELNRQGGRKRIEGTSRYRWALSDGGEKVNGKWQRRQRRVVRAKLVWMFVHRQLVPPDCLIDHRDENRLNDRASNLHALSHDEHTAKHYANEEF